MSPVSFGPKQFLPICDRKTAPILTNFYSSIKSLCSNGHGSSGQGSGGGRVGGGEGRSLPLTCVGFYSFVFYGCCDGSLRKQKQQPSEASLPAQIRPDPQGPPGWAHSPDCGSLEKYHFPSHFLAPLEGINKSPKSISSTPQAVCPSARKDVFEHCQIKKATISHLPGPYILTARKILADREDTVQSKHQSYQSSGNTSNLKQCNQN